VDNLTQGRKSPFCLLLLGANLLAAVRQTNGGFEFMTFHEIKKRVSRIRKCSGDDECAHSAEDKLMLDFISYVATLDNPSLSQKAKAVLETRKLKFERWCA
jgi:hypothetical protein